MTARATVIDVGDPLPDADQARAWLAAAGEDELVTGLAVLNRALHAHRLAAADPHAHGVGRDDPLVARLGYGAASRSPTACGRTLASSPIRDRAGVDGDAGSRPPRRASRHSSPVARPLSRARSSPSAPGWTSTRAATAQPPSRC